MRRLPILLETMRVCSGQLPLLDWHFARLSRSCRALGQAQPSPQLRAVMARAALDAGPRAILRLQYWPDTAASELQTLPWPDRPESWWRDGVTVYRCRTRLVAASEPAGLKTTSRRVYDAARREWAGEDWAEGILRDADDRWIEGTVTNLFLSLEGCLYTPDLERTGVAGVLREWLLREWAPGRGIASVEGAIGDDMFGRAEEMFLTNAVVGAWPVIRCGPHEWTPGPICRRLQQDFAALCGTDTDRA